MGGSAYFNMDTSYYDFNKFVNGVKDPVVNRVNFGGSVNDNYSLGTVRRELLLESRKHTITAKLRQIPCVGPIRAALLVALI